MRGREARFLPTRRGGRLLLPGDTELDVKANDGSVGFKAGAILLDARLPTDGSGMGPSLTIDHRLGHLRHVYVPHLTPEEGLVAGAFVFRSPAIVLADERRALALAVDLDDVAQGRDLMPWLDYDHPRRRIGFGVGAYEPTGHTFFRRRSFDHRGQRAKIRLHVLASTRKADIADPFRMTARFFWQRWGRELFRGGRPAATASRYMEHVVRWAFSPEGWGDEVWQSFDLDDERVGAPVFIVDVGRHPSVPPADRTWREPRAIWNQAWFSTQRCANGLYRHARHVGDRALEDRARAMTRLALRAPQKDGLFPSVLRCGHDGWTSAEWMSSDRRPRSVSQEACHLVDAAFTARMLVEWHHLTGDANALAFARTFADRLVDLQRPSGAFPGWVEPDGRVPAELAEGPESAVSAALLIDLAEVLDGGGYRRSARRALQFLEGVVRDARWEDFETYWSCAPWGNETQRGRRVARNGIFKQNSLSIGWCADAFLAAYVWDRQAKHLATARRCLAELSLYQSVWDPPFLTAPAHGGFGVMNADCEWNDARQSLFAPLFFRAHASTRDPELLERGAAALRASFSMMYCPENAALRKSYEAKYPFFGSESYGFMMENQGHAASDEIGTFTIFTWGNGSALAAAATVRDEWPEGFRAAFPEG
ncbi:MAG: hypothetical protein HOV80_03105 [Polyangiaceae bacterium]|nr:hypothetical protein [Polyangiaceae bacterium]